MRHRHLRLAVAVRDLPDDHSRIRHGHRGVRALDHNAAISFAFPIVNSTLGSTGTFGIFALITIVSIFFVTTFVPETKSHSLEALEDNFPRHDAAHLVHTPATVAGS